MRTIRKRVSSLAVSALLLCAALLNASSAAHAQTNVGRISGTVKDASGAVVPGASVTVANQGTAISRAATTDDDGFYLVTNLPIGVYSVLVEREGFGKAQKKDYSLIADGRLTVDFELAPGGVASEVTVTSAAGETVNDTSAEVSRVIDSEQVQDLATNGRNYMELTTLIPGAPLLTDDALDFMTSLSVNQPINGNRGNTNNLTVDGGFNLDSGSNNSQINNVGLDFVQEVSIKTSNFSAEYGRSSGAAINVSTKSGTNEFHGSFYEYFRNEKLNANHFTNNARGVFSDDLSRPGAKVLVPAGDPRVGQKVAERRPERYNNFGFSLGGPIVKNKLFFFGGMEWKIIRRVDSIQRTLPTTAELAGDFSFRLRGRDGLVGTADDGVIRDPNNAVSSCRAPVVNATTGAVTTPAVRTGCFPGNRIPSNRITADGRAIANVFSQMAARAASFTDTPTSNNTLFLEPNPFELRQEIVRVDYRPNGTHSIYGRYLHDFYNIIDPFGTLGIDSDVPTTPTRRDRPGFGIQLGHTWLVSPTMVNEFRVNAAWNSQRLVPIGDAWKRETYGFQFPELFGGGRFPDGIPRVSVQSFPPFEGPARALISPTTDIQVSDNVTMPLGKHAFKFGGILIRNRKDQNARTLSLGSATFTGSTTRTNSTQNGLADALLGNFASYQEFKFDPVGFFRFTQVEAYATDAWKVHPRLSLEIGARYRFNQPMYTQQNILSNFVPRLYDPARAVTVASNGRVTVGPGQDRFNGLIRAGGGVPEEQAGRVPTAGDPDVLRVPTGAPRGLYESSHVLEPRVGFAWSPFGGDRKTAVRGGFGIFHDRPAGTEILYSLLGNPPYNSSASFENANLASPSGGTETALGAHATVQAVDPDLKTPYTMSYSLTVQRELPWGLFAEVGYVGNQGRHLLRQPEINLPTFEELRARALLPSAQQPNLNAIRPYKGYSSIRMRVSDANSNYNAMQVYVTKRRGDLRLSVSYTWSKALADASGAGDNVDAGVNPFDRRFDHGPAGFDRRHIIATTTAYRLPFFRRSGHLLGAVLGGWELSSVFRAQTGGPLTINGDTLVGNDLRADYTGLPLDSPGGDFWFNPDAFAPAPDTRPGNTGVGVLYGPGRKRLDLAMSKSVRFGERLRARLRVDAFNALNQASWTGVNTDVDSGSFGLLTNPTSPRSIQVGVRFEF